MIAAVSPTNGEGSGIVAGYATKAAEKAGLLLAGSKDSHRLVA